MIARVIDGLVMLIGAFVIGWYLVPADRGPVPERHAAAPSETVAPATTSPVARPAAPIACPETPAPAANPPAQEFVRNPRALPAEYLELVGQ